MDLGRVRAYGSLSESAARRNLHAQWWRMPPVLPRATGQRLAPRQQPRLAAGWEYPILGPSSGLDIEDRLPQRRGSWRHHLASRQGWRLFTEFVRSERLVLPPA